MVNNKLLQPQEIEVFYIIPTIRKHFAEVMLKQGMKQKDIAEIFGITKSALSQYTSKKRANELEFTDDVLEEIQSSAKKIVDQHGYLQQTQYILGFIRGTKTLCKIHKMFSNVPTNCDPDVIGCSVK